MILCNLSALQLRRGAAGVVPPPQEEAKGQHSTARQPAEEGVLPGVAAGGAVGDGGLPISSAEEDGYSDGCQWEVGGGLLLVIGFSTP
ncbi:hypothetical protein CASFOL_002938 [Castilleja foliolosa]|uniref:Uncharacterized protein n=1 Tax=Castilleja foliolosa TaxID=1961234 RepID=A0ABD3EHN3_9LAMI